MFGLILSQVLYRICWFVTLLNLILLNERLSVFDQKKFLSIVFLGIKPCCVFDICSPEILSYVFDIEIDIIIDLYIHILHDLNGGTHHACKP
jgi:hypothetical protein